MKDSKHSIIWLVFAVFIFLSACKKDEDPEPVVFDNLEEEITYLVGQYVRTGAMVGIINKDQERQMFSFGTKILNTDQPPDINTVFEIGSMSKTFTAILLSKLMMEGVLDDDTVEHYLPADSVSLPQNGGEEIRFIHLVTHTSGIPRTLQDSDYPRPIGYNPYNPYAAYTTEIVYDYLTNFCELEFTPGTSWSYSNTGMGLLGHIIGRIDSTSYETVLQQEIFDELVVRS